jgi:hypothetical protein
VFHLSFRRTLQMLYLDVLKVDQVLHMGDARGKWEGAQAVPVCSLAVQATSGRRGRCPGAC